MGSPTKNWSKLLTRRSFAVGIDLRLSLNYPTRFRCGSFLSIKMRQIFADTKRPAVLRSRFPSSRHCSARLAPS